MPDPKLVVPDTIVGQVWAWAIHAGADVSIEDTRRVLAHHRLVQLPEEPDGWVDMEDDILLWGYTGPNDGMTPFYTPNGGIDDADCILLDFGIPGDPQEVEP